MKVMQEKFKKFSDSVLRNIDKENMNKIILLLKKYDCDYIADLLDDYLDIFMIDYDIFKEKLDNLNIKYNNNFLSLASNNMNLLEEFYK